MPQIKPLLIGDLNLDLRNYRTVAQNTEAASVHALISIDPAYFWALANSLVEDGWHGTENVVVLKKAGKNGDEFVVKEGNRRVGALKLILGQFPATTFAIPTDLAEKISKITEDWKTTNSVVPCNIFGPKEEALAERLVGLTHAKGEKAGRLEWNAVARARYSREESGASEPALDLLERYLKSGKNLTPTQKERWGGEYHLTVLAEALKRLSSRLSVTDSKEVAALYPKNAKFRDAFENILHDIGVTTLGFPELRNTAEDVLARHGFPSAPAATNSSPQSSVTAAQAGGASTATNSGTSSPSAGGANPSSGKSAAAGAGILRNSPNAVATNDPKSVTRWLKRFRPRGLGREKLVLLLNEARSLNIEKHPHAFCFLLRSMFEISAKCYCDDHKAASGPSVHKFDGSDKKLADVLKDISKHLTNNGANYQVAKELHGATAELAKSDFLSVTSLNQLVHNKKFTVDCTHISTLFHNVSPLLESMNR
jgi:hypothetical protein